MVHVLKWHYSEPIGIALSRAKRVCCFYGSIGHGCVCSCHGLAVFGVDWQLHLKRRTFAERRLHPDAAAVHLHNLRTSAVAASR